tara:strand:+ start:7 stop:384 length:378 start_codon:yes stop_codon:yes gene_type:complete
MREVNIMDKAIEKLIEKIKDDYARFMPVTGENDTKDSIREKMQKEFFENITVKKGRKYTKIITGSSVWGFIVNAENDPKFKQGDILKAAGWQMPTRNHSRGNIFADNYSVAWTGPHYMGDPRLVA